MARAEAALAELADDFSSWMDQECVRLDIARNTIKAAGITPGNRDVLFRAVHDIKGQAATLGFPQAAPVADSLCRLIEHTPDIARLPLRLIDQHVDAIRAITHRNTRGDGNRYAAQLAEKLRQVTDEFLIHENRDRPDTLESILSPALSPRLKALRRRGGAPDIVGGHDVLMLPISTRSSQNSRASSRAASVA